MKALSIALLTFKDGLHNRILYGVVIVALLLIVTSIFISGLYMWDTMKVILDICLSSVSIGGLLVPFFISITHISGDIEHRTIYTLLCTPISRRQYILGKFFGLCLLTLLIMGVLTLASLLSLYSASYIYAELAFPSLPIVQVFTVTFLSYLSIVVLIACTMLWCTITSSSFLATLLTLTTYIVGQTIADIVRFIAAKIEGVEITPLIEYTTQVLMFVFPNIGAFDLKYYASHNLAIPLDQASWLCLYAITYSAIMLLLSTALFNKKDLA